MRRRHAIKKAAPRSRPPFKTRVNEGSLTPTLKLSETDKAAVQLSGEDSSSPEIIEVKQQGGRQEVSPKEEGAILPASVQQGSRPPQRLANEQVEHKNLGPRRQSKRKELSNKFNFNNKGTTGERRTAPAKLPKAKFLPVPTQKCFDQFLPSRNVPFTPSERTIKMIKTANLQNDYHRQPTPSRRPDRYSVRECPDIAEESYLPPAQSPGGYSRIVDSERHRLSGPPPYKEPLANYPEEQTTGQEWNESMVTAPRASWMAPSYFPREPAAERPRAKYIPTMGDDGPPTARSRDTNLTSFQDRTRVLPTNQDVWRPPSAYRITDRDRWERDGTGRSRIDSQHDGNTWVAEAKGRGRSLEARRSRQPPRPASRYEEELGNSWNEVRDRPEWSSVSVVKRNGNRPDPGPLNCKFLLDVLTPRGELRLMGEILSGLFPIINALPRSLQIGVMRSPKSIALRDVLWASFQNEQGREYDATVKLEAFAKSSHRYNMLSTSNTDPKDLVSIDGIYQCIHAAFALASASKIWPNYYPPRGVALPSDNFSWVVEVLGRVDTLRSFLTTNKILKRYYVRSTEPKGHCGKFTCYSPTTCITCWFLETAGAERMPDLFNISPRPRFHGIQGSSLLSFTLRVVFSLVRKLTLEGTIVPYNPLAPFIPQMLICCRKIINSDVGVPKELSQKLLGRKQFKCRLVTDRRFTYRHIRRPNGVNAISDMIPILTNGRFGFWNRSPLVLVFVQPESEMLEAGKCPQIVWASNFVAVSEKWSKCTLYPDDPVPQYLIGVHVDHLGESPFAMDWFCGKQDRENNNWLDSEMWEAGSPDGVRKEYHRRAAGIVNNLNREDAEYRQQQEMQRPARAMRRLSAGFTENVSENCIKKAVTEESPASLLARVMKQGSGGSPAKTFWMDPSATNIIMTEFEEMRNALNQKGCGKNIEGLDSVAELNLQSLTFQVIEVGGSMIPRGFRHGPKSSHEGVLRAVLDVLAVKCFCVFLLYMKFVTSSSLKKEGKIWRRMMVHFKFFPVGHLWKFTVTCGDFIWEVRDLEYLVKNDFSKSELRAALSAPSSAVELIQPLEVFVALTDVDNLLFTVARSCNLSSKDDLEYCRPLLSSPPMQDAKLNRPCCKEQEDQSAKIESGEKRVTDQFLMSSINKQNDPLGWHFANSSGSNSRHDPEDKGKDAEGDVPPWARTKPNISTNDRECADSISDDESLTKRGNLYTALDISNIVDLYSRGFKDQDYIATRIPREPPFTANDVNEIQIRFKNHIQVPHMSQLRMAAGQQIILPREGINEGRKLAGFFLNQKSICLEVCECSRRFRNKERARLSPLQLASSQSDDLMDEGFHDERILSCPSVFCETALLFPDYFRKSLEQILTETTSNTQNQEEDRLFSESLTNGWMVASEAYSIILSILCTAGILRAAEQQKIMRPNHPEEMSELLTRGGKTHRRREKSLALVKLYAPPQAVIIALSWDVGFSDLAHAGRCRPITNFGVMLNRTITKGDRIVNVSLSGALAHIPSTISAVATQEAGRRFPSLLQKPDTPVAKMNLFPDLGGLWSVAECLREAVWVLGLAVGPIQSDFGSMAGAAANEQLTLSEWRRLFDGIHSLQNIWRQRIESN